MKYGKVIWFALILLVLGVALSGPARASQWDKKTFLTFSHSVEVPGKIVLPAGKYVFKLLDSISNRHIVQIWNEEETELITTILAIPNYRLKPTDKTVIEFHERPGTQPQALRAWFYPGDSFGQEFAYPKARAVQLAEASNEIVPAEIADVEPGPEELKSVPLVAITPTHEEEPIAQAIRTTPIENKAESTKAEELPKTASLVPLAGLCGLVVLGLGLGLRVLLLKQQL